MDSLCRSGKKDSPAALVLAGFLYSGESGSSTEGCVGGEGCETALERMKSFLGPPVVKGPIVPFDNTDYYEPEMGPGLLRRYMAFQCLMSPEFLVSLKHETASIENALSRDGKRSVNIDPGYVDLNKVVLASWKEGLFKIYIGGGVWADPVAHYFNKKFNCEEWTFPDIRSGKHFSFFSDARRLYKEILRERGGGIEPGWYIPAG